MIDPSSLAGGAALTGLAVGLIAATWGRLKTLGWRVLNLGVVRLTVEGYAGTAVQAYLWRHGRRSRLGERAYNGSFLFVRPVDRQQVVAYEEVDRDPALFWLGWRPLLAGLTGDVQGSHFSGYRLTLTFVRGTIAGEALVRAAVDEANALRHGGPDRRPGRYRVHKRVGSRRRAAAAPADPFGVGAGGSKSTPAVSCGMDADNITARRYLGYAADDIGEPTPADPMGALAFPADAEAAVRSVRRWHRSEKWYKARRVPWRYGLLLTGKPGTGKSSMARALAQDLDLPVYALELATFDDADFVQVWGEALAETPCMVLIEDVDHVFRGRENVLGEAGGGLSFGCLLNCVGGVTAADGVLLVVTTNHPETLDPALGVADAAGRASRPGRIDRVVELGPMDEACRRRLAARVLADCPAEVDAVVARGADMTAAQFQLLCTETALAHYWARAPEEDPS